MRKARDPLWWYTLRHGLDWRILVVGGAIVGLIALVSIHGAVSPEVGAERQRQAEARCVANGGHIVVAVQKFGISRTCYGG